MTGTTTLTSARPNFCVERRENKILAESRAQPLHRSSLWIGWHFLSFFHRCFICVVEGEPVMLIKNSLSLSSPPNPLALLPSPFPSTPCSRPSLHGAVSIGHPRTASGRPYGDGRQPSGRRPPATAPGRLVADGRRPRRELVVGEEEVHVQPVQLLDRLPDQHPAPHADPHGRAPVPLRHMQQGLHHQAEPGEPQAAAHQERPSAPFHLVGSHAVVLWFPVFLWRHVPVCCHTVVDKCCDVCDIAFSEHWVLSIMASALFLQRVPVYASRLALLHATLPFARTQFACSLSQRGCGYYFISFFCGLIEGV